MSLFAHYKTINADTLRRGTIKTYSRQRAHLENSYDAERPRKRIRMDATGAVVEEGLNLNRLQSDEPAEPEKPLVEDTPKGSEERTSSSATAPSSPAQEEHPLFSSDALQDDESELSSPPSSPPPRLPSPITNKRKPIFSFLKRKRSVLDNGSEPSPLKDIEPNVRRDPPPRAAKKAMKQLQIDLGGEVRKTCRTCGMEYIPSMKEDRALHKDFCGINVGGIELSKAFLRDETLRRVALESSCGWEKEEIIAIDRRSSQAVRNKIKRILEIVNAELSAAEIEDEALWEPMKPEMTEKQLASKRKGSCQDSQKENDRFKAFLYTIGEKCVGFCLAEKINNAYAVVNANGWAADEDSLLTSRSSSISVSATASVALLGISRIWISKAFRNRGFATELLECARGNFFYGVEVPKNLIAFSQPTASGGRLAERWFERQTGWHVYRGDR